MNGSNDEKPGIASDAGGNASERPVDRRSPELPSTTETSEVRRVRFGRFEVPLPRDRMVRWGAGTLLVVLGILGFLPILGFWMIPLGLLFFTPDSPGLQRAVRRFEAWTRLVSQRVRQRVDQYKRTH